MTSAVVQQLECFADAETLARHTARWLSNRALANSGRFAICLSGGSTPQRLYEILAEPPMATQMPWSRMHFFFGDERFVPHDHADSNFRMAREALLARAPIPRANVHPIPTEGLSPQDAAIAYETELKGYYGADTLDAGRPLFDVTLLGLGEDGHTASLFPGQLALTEHRRWVVAVVGAKPEPRITLTYPALDSSAEAIFLVAGQSKRHALARVCAGDPAVPAVAIHPVGRLRWFVDRASQSEPPTHSEHAP